MTDRNRLIPSGQDRPSASLLRQAKSARSVARFQDASLDQTLNAILSDEKARNYTRFVENRIDDTHDVLAHAKYAIRDDLDRAIILPIVQAYGMNVERQIRDYGRDFGTGRI